MLTDTAQNHLCTVTLLGNLVNKPDIRYQANPVIAIAEITLATHSRWFDQTSKQYKEWTSYHTVKVIGTVVEQALIYAEKGDIVLIQGYLINSKTNNREIVHANHAEVYPKGFAQSINQMQFTGVISANASLKITESNKEICEVMVQSKQTIYSEALQDHRTITVTRPVHIWGKQARFIAENSQVNDYLITTGKLSYINNKQKNQFIESQQAVLINKPAAAQS